MRIIKSAISVLLCFIMSILRGPQGIPFYSAIAAILCLQPDLSNSKKVASNRIVGTLIGGVCGMLVLLLERRFIPTNIQLLQYLLVSICIIPLIYITVLTKQTGAAYITCVVFMSVTISHGADVNPYLFALNRILDTLIGIFVSLGVNAFHIPRKKNTNILYVGDLYPFSYGIDKEISVYSKIKINQLIEKGALITFAFPCSPSHFLPLLTDIQCTLPVISMNGATLYDIKNQSYSFSKTIEYNAYQQVVAIIHKHELNCFITCEIHDKLHTYYGDFTNHAEKDFYYSNRKSPLENFVYSAPPKTSSPLMVMVLDTTLNIDILYDELVEKLTVPLNIIREKDVHTLGYCYLKIYSDKTCIKNALEELQTLLPVSSTCLYDINYSEIDSFAKLVKRHFYSKIKTLS